jgi:predicted aminopeptidase
MLSNLRIVLVILALALPGCGTVYMAQAAKGQLQILTARKPITKVLADSKVDAALKKRLQNVRDARAFAVSDLGLPNNKSYSTYADLHREYVVWSVVATPEFSVEPREWCFPIVGCVAYRGYFSEKRADDFATQLRDEGSDVVVGGVPAYSTLGKLNDPILNTMMSYGDDELASIMFHELSHQVVYIPDDSSFNEAFAVAVEREGLARWLRHLGREADLAKYERRRAVQAEGIRIVSAYRDELAKLYSQSLPADEMRARKAEVFTRLLAQVKSRDERAGIQSGLAGSLAGPPNNARLASLATYYDCVPGFERMLAAEQHDLPRFYAAVRDVAKLPREERRAKLCLRSIPENPGVVPLDTR